MNKSRHIFINSVLTVAVFTLLALVAGCATTKHTEQALTEAGFKCVAASSQKQIHHLKTLPADKLTVVRLKGKTFYVFPDPAHNQLYVGGPAAYQSYLQILSDNNLKAQSRVMADLGEDTGDDQDQWVE